MAKNRKTVFKNFSYLQCDDFAAFLSQMAVQGWHFKEWGNGLVFEKGEPEDAVYAVEVLIDGSENELRSENHTLNYADYCEAAGWRFIDSKKKFVIFKQLHANAVPIVTQEERFRNASKAYSKNLWWQVAIAFIWMFNLCLRFFPVSLFIYTVFSNMHLALAAYWVFYFVYIVSKLIGFCIWKRNAKKILAAGETGILTCAKDTLWNWINLLMAAALLIGCGIAAELWMLVLVLGCAVLGWLLYFLLGKFRPDKEINLVIQIVFIVLIIIAIFVTVFFCLDFADESVPSAELTAVLYEDPATDIGTLQDIYSNTSTSFFGTQQYCSLTYESTDFYYELYKTEYNWLLDVIWEYELSLAKNTVSTDCTALLKATAAFQNSAGEYYVRYENMILILDLGLDKTLTAEQASAVCTILGWE